MQSPPPMRPPVEQDTVEGTNVGGTETGPITTDSKGGCSTDGFLWQADAKLVEREEAMALSWP